jgi:hypothetical protein
LRSRIRRTLLGGERDRHTLAASADGTTHNSSEPRRGISLGDSDTATTYVIAPEDIVWHKTDLGPRFWLSDNLVGTDYTSVFSAQLTKFGSGGGSSPHSHTYNTRSTS